MSGGSLTSWSENCHTTLTLRCTQSPPTAAFRSRQPETDMGQNRSQEQSQNQRDQQQQQQDQQRNQNQQQGWQDEEE